MYPCVLCCAVLCSAVLYCEVEGGRLSFAVCESFERVVPCRACSFVFEAVVEVHAYCMLAISISNHS